MDEGLERITCRREAVREQIRICGDTQLPELCTILHGQVQGIRQPWPSCMVSRTVRMLNARLSFWEDGGLGTRDYDEAIRQLVRAAIEEIESAEFEGRPCDCECDCCSSDEEVCEEEDDD